MKIRPEFKRPLRVTGIVLIVTLVLVIIGSTWVYMSETSSSKAYRRAGMLGSGLGVVACLVVAPFWLSAAGKVGKERREKKLAARSQRQQKP